MNLPIYWIYRLMPDRRLEAVRDKNGLHLGYASKEAAQARASYESVRQGYPMTLDTNQNLHNTRDGRPASISSMAAFVKNS